MNKVKQEYSNHRHLVPLYHFLTFAAMLALLVGSILHLFMNQDKSLVLGSLFTLMVLTLISVSFHCRSFALKAQDRAIRAEENLRYFILTGKRLSQEISLSQIIALRFASDEEFVPLVAKTIEQNLKPDEIKRLIKNWRPDYYRA
ncbi:MAG TPA: DUF6526 family protein [Cyclobacteriaceae bacterium]|jgi:hypothetical protein|nr:DUF6526 family protein [Cyclobacteriaceae bacterium]